MIEIQLLDDSCLIGVTIRLPKVKIVLIYHTKGILVSDPFELSSMCFQSANVFYVPYATTFEELLSFRITKYRVQQRYVMDYLGMKGMDALYALQEAEKDS
ncbi:MAG: hypothetical protein PUF50_05415 [Erysipelotrichaceae bacterium]|nr:hypothetical protein [Erysipelotrichaceae bacterium]